MSDASFEQEKPEDESSTNEATSDTAAARTYFLNRAAVAESLARIYEAEVEFDRGFFRPGYIPAILGIVVASALSYHIFSMVRPVFFGFSG
jgi:hypothetical protein